MNRELLKEYFKRNVMLNILFLCSIALIFAYRIFSNWPVTNAFSDSEKYYYQIVIDISVGYIVSMIFYAIVVFFPDTKKKLIIKGKTHIIFARLQTCLHNYIDATLGAFDLEINKTDDIKSKWSTLMESTNDSYLILNREIDRSEINYEFIKNSKTYLNLLIELSKKILALKRDIIPFLVFLDKKELDFYIELEDIFIFENITSLCDETGVDWLFCDEFLSIVDLYAKNGTIVKGEIQTIPIVFSKMKF